MPAKLDQRCAAGGMASCTGSRAATATLVSHAHLSPLEIITKPADVVVGQRGAVNLPSIGSPSLVWIGRRSRRTASILSPDPSGISSSSVSGVIPRATRRAFGITIRPTRSIETNTGTRLPFHWEIGI